MTPLPCSARSNGSSPNLTSIPSPDRPLVTVLFTDIVSSTERLAERGDTAWRQFLDDHEHTMNHIVTKYRGRLVKTTGDGILATFDGPARAVRCAIALGERRIAKASRLAPGCTPEKSSYGNPTSRASQYTFRESDPALAGPNEILVSRTVVDLTAGSGLDLRPVGEHQLKGVPGTWPLFNFHRADAAQ